MNILAKLKEFGKHYGYDLFFGVCVILIAIISYNLGRVRALEKSPIIFGQDAQILSAIEGEQGTRAGENAPAPKKLDPRVVASKASSSKLYHFTWCSGAKRIKEENKLWFDTAKTAETAGYTLAGNCQ